MLHNKLLIIFQKIYNIFYDLMQVDTYRGIIILYKYIKFHKYLTETDQILFPGKLNGKKL